MTPEQKLKRIKEIIENVDYRAMAVDGDVTPTLQEMTQAEISEIYELSCHENNDACGDHIYTGSLQDIFREALGRNDPFAFYFLQPIPYQKYKRNRLKLHHDVVSFDGRTESQIWPNGEHCGTIHDKDVEYIQLSTDQICVNEWDFYDD